MLKRILIMALLASSLMYAQAQPEPKPLKKVMTLQMPGENGANGASILWHPVQKKYYTAFAGNTSYPFAVFSPTGKLQSSDDLETGFDIRGLWYNTVTKRIESNGYNDFGWTRFTLDPKGIPNNNTVFVEEMHQPEDQSVGTFDAVKKQVIFLKEGIIYYYDQKGMEQESSITLELPEGDELADDEELWSKYNGTTVCYTGIPNAEFAVLNHDDLRIELYNRKGKLSKSYSLPDDTPVNESFNFGFANNIFWIFDKDERQWLGFK